MRAVENGAAVLTASRRLARVLTQQFNKDQRDQGRSVWPAPQILPLDAYVRRCWREWIISGQSAGQPPTLLSPVQEQAVWERIIRESPQGESLLRIPETAQAAMDAWRLVQSFRLPINGQFEASEDSAAFLRWAKEFQKTCDANNWLEEARLSDFVMDLLRRAHMAQPAHPLLAGFDDFTPQQFDLIESLGKHEVLSPRRFESQPQCYRARDSSEEIQLAAQWARDRIRSDPGTQIGVVVPQLSKLRSKVERIFREELHPGALFGDADRAFHLSLGSPLSDHAMIHAAFSLLEFARGDVPLPLAGTLLRSPFLGGAEEQSARAALDARLRRRGIWNVSLGLLRDHAGGCPELQRIAPRAQAEIANIEPLQRASGWAATFSKVLRAFGWPGERPLSSREYQVADAWQSVLSTFAELDSTAPPFTFGNAIDALRALAGRTLFQVENEGAPVQIMGVLEASGLSFDHLWVMGLRDEALPAPARPNPFLPLSMQREHRLPHASPERELEFAKKILARLLASAPDVVLSYPAQEGEQTLLPTPLLGAVEWLAPREHATHGWAAAMRGAGILDPLADEAGPPMPGLSVQKGGTSLFKDMAACPFRAFVQHRLNARTLDDPAFGLDARDKGKLVHKALELIWTELQTHERLCNLGPVVLSDVVSRNVRAALEQQSGGLGRSLEQIRLEHLLMDWLEIEKHRPPFAVLGPEQKRLVTIGGLTINLRIDRVDELPTGYQIILDYKTGEVKGSAWMGDRPTEPQVPLYCATSGAPVAGAALVQIHAGDFKVRGLDQSGSFPDLKRMQAAGDGALPQQIEEWKRVLAVLAERFRAGHAEVDPLPGACDYCGVTALCRIRELERA